MHIRHIRIHKYFPPDDELGLLVAKLCILTEDYLLEASGVIEESLPSLDTTSLAYRKTYFIRNALKTVHEIKGCIQTICKNKEFKKALKAQEKIVKAKFAKQKEALIKHEEKFKKIRNSLGGHVLKGAVQAGLKKLDAFDEGLLQIGSMASNSHFKFVDQIVAGALIALMQKTTSTRQDSAKQIIESFCEEIKEAFDSAIDLIDMIFCVYVRHRKLN